MASLVKKKVPNKPWGFLGARKGKNKMRQFGKVKYMQKPKSPEDWHKIYLQHQIELPHVKSISLNWSSYGPKQAGIRYFKYFQIPPIKYWNKSLEVRLNKSKEVVIPSVELELENGQVLAQTAAGLNEKDILQWVRQANDALAVLKTTENAENQTENETNNTEESVQKE